MTLTESDRFEERLLAELRDVVAENPPPARVPRPRNRRLGGAAGRRLVLAGGAGVTAFAAVALAVGSGGTATPAYAVETESSGSVAVSIHSLGDPAGLQSTLREAGVPAVVDFDPADQQACVRTPRVVTPNVRAHEDPGGVYWAELPDGGSLSNYNFLGLVIHTSGEATFYVNPNSIKTGETLAVTSSDATVETIQMSISSQSPDAGCTP